MRSVGSKGVVIRNGFTDRTPLTVTLSAYETPHGWAYGLLLQIPELVSRALPEGGIVMFRTTSGEIVEFKQTLPEHVSRDYVGQWIEGSASKIYYNSGAYLADLDGLSKLSEGVAKVRIQTSDSYIDIEYKKERWGKAMTEMLGELQASIESGADIRSGF